MSSENKSPLPEEDAAPSEINAPATDSSWENAESVPAEESAYKVADAPATDSGGQMSEVAPPQKKKRKWIWNIVLVVILALGLYSLFGIAGEVTKGDGLTFSEAMSNINALGAVMLVCVVLLIMIVDCLKFCFVNKAVIGRMRPAVAIKTSFIGRFYDGITPFSTGGQPFQIYYMTTKGINVSDSSAIALIRYFGSIFGFAFIGAVFMILGVVFGVLDGVSGGTLLLVAGWVGLAVNLILPVFILFFVFFPRLASKCTALFINIGVKLHIVKNREKVMAKALKIVDDFVSSFKIIVKRPLLLILFLICCFAENFLTFSVPYFVMNALSCNLDGMFIAVMSLNIFAIFGVSFIPTPGNSGVVEGMGVLAFSLAAGAALAWAVLFWRFAVYYIYIFIGIGITIFDLIAKNIKSKKKVKNE